MLAGGGPGSGDPTGEAPGDRPPGDGDRDGGPDDDEPGVAEGLGGLGDAGDGSRRAGGASSSGGGGDSGFTGELFFGEDFESVEQVERRPAGDRGLWEEGFAEWVDRLRQVEEVLPEERLREDASRVLDRVRELRRASRRHAHGPQWELVMTDVLEPLERLEEDIDRALLLQDDRDPLAPVDRDPVPPQYAELVRRYYQALAEARREGETTGPSESGTEAP